jgi:phytoene dehydrogenase-like protein
VAAAVHLLGGPTGELAPRPPLAIPRSSLDYRLGMPDAIVVGAGPNGLAAALTFARAGLSVRLVEANDTVGGGLRSMESTLPGFIHDPCTTILGTTAVSPFFKGLDLSSHGVEYVTPEAPLGHAFDDGPPAMLERSVDVTAAGLGRAGPSYRRLMAPLVADVDKLMPWLFGPVLRPPRHPIAQARFGLPAILPLTVFARLAFRDQAARALLAGLSAHSMLRLDRLATTSFGIVLAMTAHVSGWPVIRGGSGRLAAALAAELRSLGGEIETGFRVTSLVELGPAKAILLDLAPRSVAQIAGEALPAGYRRRLERFRYGPGVFKVDWALDGPIPWRSPELARAGTVHLGGPLAEVVAAERAPHDGQIAERPFVLLVQATTFDPSRAPAGKHTAWGYCHVPAGSTVDVTDRIEGQIERFAPGFRDRVLGRATTSAVEMESYDANYVGGDINSGAQDLAQILARPVLAWDPYRTPRRGLYICSSSTPPGGGAHGMSGHLAAKSALRHEFGVS